MRIRYTMLALPLLLPLFAHASEATPSPAVATIKKHKAPPAQGPHLDEPSATFPLVLIKGYPFVEGSIDGRQGKLLFDLGESDALVVNNHTVEAPGAITIGTGQFGSGQTFDSVSYPMLAEAVLPGRRRYTDMSNVRGSPGLPIEQHITPDHIGWLGLNYFTGYVAKIDYARPAVSFYRDDASGAGEKAALAGERIVRSIHISRSAEHKNLIYAQLKVGSMDVLALFDTGAHSSIAAAESQLAALKKAGSLRAGDDETSLLSDAVLDGLPLAPMTVNTRHDVPPYKKFLPPTDNPVMVLGYEFLNRYKTVWDFDDETLTLLEK